MSIIVQRNCKRRKTKQIKRNRNERQKLYERNKNKIRKRVERLGAHQSENWFSRRKPLKFYLKTLFKNMILDNCAVDIDNNCVVEIRRELMIKVEKLFIYFPRLNFLR